MTKECCRFLLNQIAFYHDAIRPCCSFSIEKNNLFSKNYTGTIEGIKKYLEVREDYINKFINGEKPPCYSGCTIYENSEAENANFKLTTLIISHRIYCSCNCIYCEPSSYGDTQRRNYLNKQSSYDIMPILDYLKDNDLIEENCRVLLCGGECSEYPKKELAYLLYWALSLKCELLMLSSGIKYSELIAQTLKVRNNILKISVDAGTKETFEKVKRVKAYDDVWKNIKKYIKVTKKYKADNTYVELKYIIIPNINDTIKEAQAFINKVRQVGCEYVRIDVEHEWIDKNKYDTQKHTNVKKIINYFFDELYNDKIIKIDFEGVEKDWLWSFVKDKYTIPRISR